MLVFFGLCWRLLLGCVWLVGLLFGFVNLLYVVVGILRLCLSSEDGIG